MGYHLMIELGRASKVACLRGKGWPFEKTLESKIASDPPSDEKKPTFQEKVLEALRKNAIGERQFETFLAWKGILPSFGRLQGASPKVSVFISKHLDDLIREYREDLILNILT